MSFPNQYNVNPYQQGNQGYGYGQPSFPAQPNPNQGYQPSFPNVPAQPNFNSAVQPNPNQGYQPSPSNLQGYQPVVAQPNPNQGYQPNPNQGYQPVVAQPNLNQGYQSSFPNVPQPVVTQPNLNQGYQPNFNQVPAQPVVAQPNLNQGYQPNFNQVPAQPSPSNLQGPQPVVAQPNFQAVQPVVAQPNFNPVIQTPQSPTVQVSQPISPTGSVLQAVQGIPSPTSLQQIYKAQPSNASIKSSIPVNQKQIRFQNGISISILSQQSSRRQWAEKLRSFLKSFLANFIDEDQIDILFDIEVKNLDGQNLRGIDVFERAFIDPSMSTIDNYEVLETLGDSCVGILVVNYFIEKDLQKASSGNLTWAKVRYASNIVQGKIALHHHLDELLLQDPTIMVARSQTSDKVGEFGRASYGLASDIYEALFGALYKCGENIVAGYGMALIQAMFLFFVRENSVLFEEGDRDGDYKTKTSQMFEKFNERSEFGPGSQGEGGQEKALKYNFRVTRRPMEAGGIEVTISLTENQITLLERLNLWNNKLKAGTVIGIGNNSDGDVAEEEAFKNAYNHLTQFNINKDTMAVKKRSQDEEDMKKKGDGPRIISQSDLWLKSQGYVNYEVKKLNKHSDKSSQTLSFIGIKDDGTKIVVFNMVFANTNTFNNTFMMLQILADDYQANHNI